MAAAARMQQWLAVFFKAYAAQAAQAQRYLSAAALPAARRALSTGPSIAKSAAPQLLKFVSSLLQVGTWPSVQALDFACSPQSLLTDHSLSHVSQDELYLRSCCKTYRMQCITQSAPAADSRFFPSSILAGGAGRSGNGRSPGWMSWGCCGRGGPQRGAGLPTWQCYKGLPSRPSQAGEQPGCASSIPGLLCGPSNRAVCSTHCASDTCHAHKSMSLHQAQMLMLSSHCIATIIGRVPLINRGSA